MQQHRIQVSSPHHGLGATLSFKREIYLREVAEKSGFTHHYFEGSSRKGPLNFRCFYDSEHIFTKSMRLAAVERTKPILVKFPLLGQEKTLQVDVVDCTVQELSEMIFDAFAVPIYARDSYRLRTVSRGAWIEHRFMSSRVVEVREHDMISLERTNYGYDSESLATRVVEGKIPLIDMQECLLFAAYYMRYKHCEHVHVAGFGVICLKDVENIDARAFDFSSLPSALKLYESSLLSATQQDFAAVTKAVHYWMCCAKKNVLGIPKPVMRMIAGMVWDARYEWPESIVSVTVGVAPSFCFRMVPERDRSGDAPLTLMGFDEVFGYRETKGENHSVAVSFRFQNNKIKFVFSETEFQTWSWKSKLSRKMEEIIM